MGTQSAAVELTAESAEAYLRERGLIPGSAAATVEELGWGISNLVLKVTAGDDCFVVKQSLPFLRVEAEWAFDRSRILVERDCMAYLGRLLPPGSVPEVRFSDEESYLFAMSCAPAGGALWKESLLFGEIDLAAAERAGALLAEIHLRSSTDPWARERFADQTVLLQGRVDPYHRTTAAAHPDLAPLIEAEVERMLATRRALVLGDYAPKNTFVYGDHVLVLDFEVAHWGDPAFDPAFCLTHLTLKACRFPERAAAYLEAARVFWRAYRSGVHGEVARDLEANTAAELGCLLLARIDGKSKIEYITGEPAKELVRGLAREVVAGGASSPEDVLAAAEARL